MAGKKKGSALSAFKSNGSLTLYSLRKIAGTKAKRSSARNSCVAAELEGKSYAKPAVGMGGRKDKRIQDAFKAASKKCSTATKAT